MFVLKCVLLSGCGGSITREYRTEKTTIVIGQPLDKANPNCCSLTLTSILTCNAFCTERGLLCPHFFSHIRKESVWYGVHPDQDFLWQILPFDIGLPQNSFGYTLQSCSANECSWARRAYFFLQTVPAVNQCAWSQWSIYQLYLCCDYTNGLEGVPTEQVPQN